MDVVCALREPELERDCGLVTKDQVLLNFHLFMRRLKFLERMLRVQVYTAN